MALIVLAAVNGAMSQEVAAPHTDPFQSGKEGYHTYRIPAIVLTSKNTLLAFCEGRKTSSKDHGDVDLVLRRSTDLGATWQPMQLVFEQGGSGKITIGNPCPVVDRSTGVIWLGFCRDNDRVFITHSEDDGATWAGPREITATVKKPEWQWIATGPGHGLQLAGGRMILPSDCKNPGANTQHSMSIYSDDHGKSWKLGGVTDTGMNECQAAELSDGSVLLTMRNYRGQQRRAFSLSRDGGLGWSPPRTHEQVFCPVCQASLLNLAADGKPALLYSGPAGPKRSHMTIRRSDDDGKTWPVSRLLYEGDAAYSDLVALPDGSVGCLFERDRYKTITFARFTIDWLQGK